jgi:YVTN family beta-propeller protein
MNINISQLGVVLVLAGCGHHAMSDPSTIPIDPITSDAVYVVNGDDSSISVIDATTDEIAGTIELVDVEYPHHIYLSPDRSTLLVAVPGADLSGGHGGGGHGGHDAAGGAVLVLEATTGALQRSRRLDAANHNAIYSPDGTTVWTSQMTAPGQVLILDAATLATRNSITVGDSPAEVTFDRSGAYAFVANTGSDDVSVMAAATGALLGAVDVGDGPVGAWPGSDGLMYVDNEAGKSISVIDPATRSVASTFALGFTPALAAIAPNGELWVTDTDNGKLVFLDAASGAKLGDLATGRGAHAFVFSATGARTYVTNQLDGTVTVVATATRTVLKTITVGAKPNGILFRAR